MSKLHFSDASMIYRIILMRKAIIYRKREEQFNNSYRATDKPLPTYNALEDPYLSGYFDKP